MLERRKEPRTRISVQVSVSGSDARGEAFSEMVLATNLSRSGALLTQVRAELRCGDFVMVEHGERRSLFRVVWVLADREDAGQAAIHRVRGQCCPWESLLPSEEGSMVSLVDKG
jgi:hypothetical protein